MPIYEYRCGHCGHKAEYLQKLSDPPVSDCPSCGQSSMTKLVSAAGFQLKGTGWYATDFKNNGAKPPAKSDASKSEASKGEVSKTGESGVSGESEKSSGKADAAPACGSGGCPACS